MRKRCTLNPYKAPPLQASRRCVLSVFRLARQAALGFHGVYRGYGVIRLRVSKGLGFITITLGLGADC